MDLGLKGRVALVTGGSQGIGRSIAELLGREGASVAVTYCHNKDKAEETAAAVRGAGAEALVCYLDLRAQESIRETVESAIRKWGRIDILVNNALFFPSAPSGSITESAPDQWRDLLRGNIEGTYTAIQSVLPSMRAHSWGRIVTMSSVLALNGYYRFAWYGAAKAALHGVTRSLYRELAPNGILINAVMPGLTLTPSILRRVSPQFRNVTAQSTPIKRLLKPEEIAPVVIFLASPANTAITGEIVRASGGY